MATVHRPSLAELAQDDGPRVRAAQLTVAILANAAVILRLWARHIQKAGYGLDDYLILLALVMTPILTQYNNELIDCYLAIRLGNVCHHTCRYVESITLDRKDLLIRGLETPAVSNGLGRHVDTIQPKDLIREGQVSHQNVGQGSCSSFSRPILPPKSSGL